ncbi:MAG: hypothetical protein Q8K98_13575 [Bacteroidota bacterium]|nr:hypothetical protein [Bacteroidota bacterium]
MKKIILVVALILGFAINIFADIKLLSTKGDVKIRRGVSEQWQQIKAGEILNYDDAIFIGTKSTATVSINGQKKIALPEKTIVEISDLRFLTKEELLLKLAMDRIIAVPQQDRRDELMPAQTTVIHGEKKSETLAAVKPTVENALKMLNGAKLLFDNKFYGTCALRVREVLRIHPTIETGIEYKLLTANSLEKAELYDEALSEYTAILNDAKIDSLRDRRSDRNIIEKKIEVLKKKNQQ